MQKVTTRDLAHHAAKITEILSSGESLEWVSRGRLIARLLPPEAIRATAKRNWIHRARDAGAINRAGRSLSSVINDSRG